MNKKIINNILIIIIMLIFPVITHAEDTEVPKYKVGIEKINLKSQNSEYISPGTTTILSVTDYIYTYSNGEISRLDKNFNLIDSESVSYRSEIQFIEDTIYVITPENGIKFSKYNESLELQTEKVLKTTTFNIGNYVTHYQYYNNHHYYLYYQNNSTINLMILDNESNIISDNELPSEIKIRYNYNFAILNNNLYLKTTNLGNESATYFYQIDNNGIKTESSVVSNYDINTIIQGDKDNFVALGYDDSNVTYILKLDNNFNIIEKINCEDILDDSSINLDSYSIYKTENSYIFSGRTTTSEDKYKSVLIFCDNNLEYQYTLDYTNDVIETNGASELSLYVDENQNIYAHTLIGNSGYTPDYGEAFVRFDLDTYKITTEVLEGKGQIKSNLYTALPGEKITIQIIPDEGYVVDNYLVKTIDGEKIEVINNTFTMPETDVIIEAKFNKIAQNPETSIGISIIVIIFLAVSCMIAIKICKKKEWLKG